MLRKLFRLFIFGFLAIFTLGTIGAGLVGCYFYFRLTRDLPRIEKLSDYTPRAASSILSEDGTLLAEVFDQLRYPVKLEEVPLLVRHAFLAAEDANFYNHPGIDITGILRAVKVNFQSGHSRQGASTITQQVVKSLLLTREKTMERKAKEAILAYRLEHALSKDEIFSIYLNEIFLGAHAYGVRAAAKVHFHKELGELSLAQAAFLASLPQRPSELINPKNRQEALDREYYVLGQMLKNQMITQDQYEQAKKEKIQIYPPNLNTLYRAPFYVSHAQVVAEDILRGINKRYSLKSPGGFRIVTAADLRAYDISEQSLRTGLEDLDKRRGWRGPLMLKPNQLISALEEQQKQIETEGGIRDRKIYKAEIVSLDQKARTATVRVGDFEGIVDIGAAGWAKRFLSSKDEVTGGEPMHLLQKGMIIEVSLDVEKAKRPQIKDITQSVSFRLDETPEVEGAFVALNILTGEVKTIIGGYSYQESVFNRATQGELQPGSSFKPFIYVAAVDTLGFTPSTIVPDSPISLIAGNGKVWSPHNFDNKFLGPITLRTALQKSRNVVSVYLLNKLGVDRGIQSARNLGITTDIPRNMSISLGTPQVKLIEMVRAYGAFGASGWLADSLVVKQIYDRNGNLIYEQRPKQKKVLRDEVAFIMAHMMKGVVERGTATVVKALNRPVAGKTGTTNDHMDAWFIGYTPEYAAGVWVGFDVKRGLGKQETGGKAAAPVFLSFMQQYLQGTPVVDFDIPDGVVPVAVDLGSGRPTDPSNPGAFIEYFESGKEPGSSQGHAGSSQEQDSGDSASSPKPQDYISGDEF